MTSVRPLGAADLEWAADLLTRNSADNLTAAERASGGFVQSAFGPDEVVALCEGTGGFVAEADGLRAGLALTSAPGRVETGPIGRIDELARERFGSGAYVMYGPVVVDAAFRRRGVSRALLTHARVALAERFTTGVAFVEGTNPVSLATHRRLGLSEFATFDVGARSYHAFSFATMHAA